MAYRQPDSMDCGPTCLRIIAKYYGKSCSLQYLREHSFITREGVTMLGLSEAAENIGFRTLGAKITLDDLADNMPLPCILHWNQNHFVVCYGVRGKGTRRKFLIADPGIGKVSYNDREMRKHWLSGMLEGNDVGLVMQIEPGTNFYDIPEETNPKDGSQRGLRYFLKYILPFRKQIAELLVGALVVMMLSYCTPFLSQSMVDIGIKNRDLNFIVLIMVVQIIIALSQTVLQFVQSWISLRMNTLININLVEDYLKKLTRMPLYFFETKTLGDILQRIGDHSRIKSFLMNNLVDMFFSVGTFLVFGTVLSIYNGQIFAVFIIGNGLYVLWTLLFMKYRRELDYKSFEQSAKLQNNMVQFFDGLPEIKMNGIERSKLWEWEHLQAGMYKISMRALRIGQIQSSGSLFFSTTTNIFVSYISARMVVTGEITLGMMMSLSFIIGQVAGPIGSFVRFAHSWQDAKISLERLNDINGQVDELTNMEGMLSEFDNGDITLDHVSYSYSGDRNQLALNEVSLIIPKGKVTAIVGASGSGKSTLMKLLQGFYKPLEGRIMIGKIPLQMIRPQTWRKRIGAVMQDGFIFTDTIAHNIGMEADKIDNRRLYEATSKANLLDYITLLPNNFNTKIGREGIGLSQGQKQRILIARTLYKNPDYVFLDEATNALDANNEGQIMANLLDFFSGKTLVVVAHRLSTVRGADNIIVLDRGRIVEQGTHDQLIQLGGYYYSLIKNQLELNG